ncbi:MAG: serine hydrolase domain-containing protein [Marinoscillum sp.]
MMKNLTYTFLASLAIVGSCQQRQTSVSEQLVIDEPAKARIDSVLQTFISDSIVVGASALIFERGKEVYFNAYGDADREAGVPMARNTIVTIYSMTKPITGVTLMSLYEKGLFRLEDSLSKYVPEFSGMQVAAGLDESGEMILEPANRAVTIADITRHTAGFSRRSDLGLDEVAKKADLLKVENTLGDMAAQLSQIPLGYHPGERWEYGISVDVQAYLIEILAKKPFDQYMRETVLDPLGMNETGYFVPETKRSRVAAINYKTDTSLNRVPDDQVHALNYDDWPMKPGGWGLKATIDDYMKFAQMLLRGGTYNGTKVLNLETVRLMATNHLLEVEDSLWLPSKGQVGFGIDFAVRVAPPKSASENSGVVGEFFWDGAASTLFWVDPKNDLTAVLFVQVFPFQGAVHKRFRDAVYGTNLK